MSYILIEESAFQKLIKRITGKQKDIRYDFTEEDYWMGGKEVCSYLQISTALLNSYRNSQTISYCKIKETYHYKRADVYKLKASMDRELLESGAIIGDCRIINT